MDNHQDIQMQITPETGPAPENESAPGACLAPENIEPAEINQNPETEECAKTEANAETEEATETEEDAEDDEGEETAFSIRSILGSKRQRILLIAALLICLAIMASGTLAYFTASETAYNIITTGVVSMKIVEETADGKPWPKDGISGVTPGTEEAKIVFIENVGSVDIYVRMSVTTRVTGRDDAALSNEYVSMDINTTDWTEKDGFYYYNTPVKPQERTVPLFTKVMFSPDMDNSYMSAKIEVDVHADAVQQRNNGETVMDAIGWPDKGSN